MKRLDHADLGLGRTTSDDARQGVELIDLILAQGIKLRACHDRALRVVLRSRCKSGELAVWLPLNVTNKCKYLLQDSNLLSDGDGSSEVITSEHSRND